MIAGMHGEMSYQRPGDLANSGYFRLASKHDAFRNLTLRNF